MSRIFSVTAVMTFIMTHSVMAANIVDHVAMTTKNIAVTNVSKDTFSESHVAVIK